MTVKNNTCINLSVSHQSFNWSSALRLCHCRVCSLLYKSVREVVYLARRSEVVVCRMMQIQPNVLGQFVPSPTFNIRLWGTLWPSYPLNLPYAMYNSIITRFTDPCLCIVLERYNRKIFLGCCLVFFFHEIIAVLWLQRGWMWGWGDDR